MLSQDHEVSLPAQAAITTQIVITNNPIMDGLSHEEYFKKVDDLIGSMRQYWKQEQRVKSLKAAIQLTKLLADTSQLKLYAKKYRLVTNSLDEFGQLIYERVHSFAKSRAVPANDIGEPLRYAGTQSTATTLANTHTFAPLPALSNRLDGDRNTQGVAVSDQREVCKEICRNWFLKVASIRELVPRYFIELAILRACDILFSSSSPTIDSTIEEQFYIQSLRRLTKMAWGFGNPIVALHARAYLCEVADRLIGWKNESRQATMLDFIAANLKCCCSLVSRLDVDLIISDLLLRVQIDDAPNHNRPHQLYYELLSSPMQSILRIVARKLEHETESLEEDQRKLHQAGSIIEKSLSGMLDELLHEISREKCCTFKKNIVLSAIVRAAPNIISSAQANELMHELINGNDLWKEQLNANDMSDEITRKQQLVISTTYATLTYLMLALEDSEKFEMSPVDGETTSSNGNQDNLLASAELIVLTLSERERISVATASADYLRCFKAMLTYATHHANVEDVDRLLTEFTRITGSHLINRYANHHASSLLDIIKTLFTSRTKFEDLKGFFRLKSFHQLFELLRKDEHRLDASKWILETTRANIKLTGLSNKQAEYILDRPMITFLLKLFLTINDSLSPLTPADELNHLSQLVIFYVDFITQADVLERLEFYSRCRSCLGNLNQALQYLIEEVLKMPDKHMKLERKRAARLNLLNGCLAYAFSAIPAIHDPDKQLDLYLIGCELSLKRSSLSLADYYMKQIITNILGQLQKKGLDPNKGAIMNQYNGTDPTFDSKDHPNYNSFIEKKLALILNLMLEHQDYIDLKHKLALSTLIMDSFARCSSLMFNLKHLNCPEDIDDSC